MEAKTKGEYLNSSPKSGKSEDVSLRNSHSKKVINKAKLSLQKRDNMKKVARTLINTEIDLNETEDFQSGKAFGSKARGSVKISKASENIHDVSERKAKSKLCKSNKDESKPGRKRAESTASRSSDILTVSDSEENRDTECRRDTPDKDKTVRHKKRQREDSKGPRKEKGSEDKGLNYGKGMREEGTGRNKRSQEKQKHGKGLPEDDRSLRQDPDSAEEHKSSADGDAETRKKVKVSGLSKRGGAEEIVSDDLRIRSCPTCKCDMPNYVFKEHIKDCLKEYLKMVARRRASEDAALEEMTRVREKRRESAIFGAEEMEEEHYVCQICQKDLSHMNSVRRTQHMNKCIDQMESNRLKEISKKEDQTRPVEQTRPIVLDCPMCGKPFKTDASRKTHLKKCAKTLNVSTEQMMQAVKAQEKEHQDKPCAAPPEQVQAKKSTKSQPVKQPRRKAKGPQDEATQLAMALSSSLADEERKKEQALIGQLNLRGITSSVGQQEASDGKKKRKKNAAPAPTPLLLQLSKTEAQNRIAERVTQLIVPQVEVDDIQPTPHPQDSRLLGLPGTKRLTRGDISKCTEMLWSRTALLDSDQVGDTRSLYYTETLMPPISLCRVKAGSKLKQVSSIPGRRKSQDAEIHPKEIPLEDSAPSQVSPLVASTQTALVLAEMAYEDAIKDATGVGCGTVIDQVVDVAGDNDVVGDAVSAGEDDGDDDLKEASGFCPEELIQIKDDSTSDDLSALQRDYLAMVDNPQHSDVAIATRNNRKICAHKIILAARCPSLLQLSSNSIVSLADNSKEALVSILKYLYAGALYVQTSYIQEVRDLAERFVIHGLVRLCETAEESQLQVGQEDQPLDVESAERERRQSIDLLFKEMLSDSDLDLHPQGQDDVCQKKDEGSSQSDDDEDDWREIYCSQRQQLQRRKSLEMDIGAGGDHGGMIGNQKKEFEDEKSDKFSYSTLNMVKSQSKSPKYVASGCSNFDKIDNIEQEYSDVLEVGSVRDKENFDEVGGSDLCKNRQQRSARKQKDPGHITKSNSSSVSGKRCTVSMDKEDRQGFNFKGIHSSGTEALASCNINNSCVGSISSREETSPNIGRKVQIDRNSDKNVHHLKDGSVDIKGYGDCESSKPRDSGETGLTVRKNNFEVCNSSEPTDSDKTGITARNRQFEHILTDAGDGTCGEEELFSDDEELQLALSSVDSSECSAEYVEETKGDNSYVKLKMGHISEDDSRSSTGRRSNQRENNSDESEENVKEPMADMQPGKGNTSKEKSSSSTGKKSKKRRSPDIDDSVDNVEQIKADSDVKTRKRHRSNDKPNSSMGRKSKTRSSLDADAIHLETNSNLKTGRGHKSKCKSSSKSKKSNNRSSGDMDEFKIIKSGTSSSEEEEGSREGNVQEISEDLLPATPAEMERLHISQNDPVRRRETESTKRKRVPSGKEASDSPVFHKWSSRSQQESRTPEDKSCRKRVRLSTPLQTLSAGESGDNKMSTPLEKTCSSRTMSVIEQDSLYITPIPREKTRSTFLLVTPSSHDDTDQPIEYVATPIGKIVRNQFGEEIIVGLSATEDELYTDVKEDEEVGLSATEDELCTDLKEDQEAEAEKVTNKSGSLNLADSDPGRMSPVFPSTDVSHLSESMSKSQTAQPVDPDEDKQCLEKSSKRKDSDSDSDLEITGDNLGLITEQPMSPKFFGMFSLKTTPGSKKSGSKHDLSLRRSSTPPRSGTDSASDVGNKESNLRRLSTSSHSVPSIEGSWQKSGTPGQEEHEGGENSQGNMADVWEGFDEMDAGCHFEPFCDADTEETPQKKDPNSQKSSSKSSQKKRYSHKRRVSTDSNVGSVSMETSGHLHRRLSFDTSRQPIDEDDSLPSPSKVDQGEVTLEFEVPGGDSFLWNDDNAPEDNTNTNAEADQGRQPAETDQGRQSVQTDNFKTPVSCQPKKPAKKWEPPSPFTPMPAYDKMTTPQLKVEVSKFGVRPVGKKRMKLILNDIYQQTHQYETDSDYEPDRESTTVGSAKGRPTKASLSSATAGSAEGRPTKASLSSATTGSAEGRSTKASLSSTTAGRPAAASQLSNDVNTSRSDTSASEDGSQRSVTSSQGSECSDVPEESFMMEDEELSASQQDSEADLSSKLLQFIKKRPDIQIRMAMYEPLELDWLKKEVQEAGIKCPMQKLMDFLDEKCITFTMKKMSKRNANRRQPRKKKKVKIPAAAV